MESHYLGPGLINTFYQGSQLKSDYFKIKIFQNQILTPALFFYLKAHMCLYGLH